MGIWSLVGAAMLVHRGLSPQQVLADPALDQSSIDNLNR
jgi:hypothetical protein